IVEALMIEMPRGQQMAVQPCGQVGMRIEQWYCAAGNSQLRHGHPSKQDPVSKQDRYDNQSKGACTALEEQDRAYGIAERDPLEYAEDAQRVQRKMWEGVDEQPEAKQNRRAPQRRPQDIGLAAPTFQPARDRDDTRDSEHEQEAGEDDIGEGTAIPGR